MPLKYTPVEEIPLIVKRCRDAFRSGSTRTVEQRKTLMRAIMRMIDEKEEELCAAVHADLRKPKVESQLSEISQVRTEGYVLLDRIDELVAPVQAVSEGLLRYQDCTIRRDPLGVVLIVSPWNYPVQLALLPILGAIAAGNTVVLKPSELAPATAALLQELLPQYVPPEVVAVVNGAVTETTRLLEERFDHIMYTGNSRVGSIVMAAAAKHLTPVTLELGGKSPAIVDESCAKDIRVVAKRIMWGKVLNAGQICVAPDYVLVHSSVKDKLVEALKIARNDFLGDAPLEGEDYPSIVNDIHFKRLRSLMNGCNMLFGGEYNEEKRLIAPTVFDNVAPNHPLMTDEIFGPLLPILTFDQKEEAIEFVNAREKPLALYIFSNTNGFISSVIENTSSGGVTVNDIILHIASPYLPFGGVGQSGMGSYHGKYSFETFSHRKSVFRRDMGMEFVDELRYPPYTEKKLQQFRNMMEPSKETSKFKRFLWTVSSPFVLLSFALCETVRKRSKSKVK